MFKKLMDTLKRNKKNPKDHKKDDEKEKEKLKQSIRLKENDIEELDAKMEKNKIVR